MHEHEHEPPSEPNATAPAETAAAPPPVSEDLPRRSTPLGRSIVAGIAAVVILGLLVGVLWSLMRGGPFEGETAHDFGVIPIGDEAGWKEHTFVLTNRTSRVIPIEGARASCGCTTMDVSTEFVEPGEDLEVTARLTLSRPGLKHSSITILTGDAGRVTLRVQGIGRSERPLRATGDEVVIFPGGTGSITFTIDRYGTGETPPELRLTAPEGVTLTAEPWERFAVLDEDQGKPAQWKARVTVDPPDGGVQDGWTLLGEVDLPETEGVERIELPMVERVSRRVPGRGEGRMITPPGGG